MKKINEYENIIIIDSLLKDQEIQETIKQCELFLLSHKVEIINKEDWGLRKLAFKIKNRHNGYYYIFRYKTNSINIEIINKINNKNDKIIRSMIIKLDKNAINFYNKK
ncbi:MAG: 30S ribosomal protein S6, partial [Bacteroides sp.]